MHACQDVTAVLTTNVTICEFPGNGSKMPLELCIAAAEAAVGNMSRLYVDEIRWRRPGISMTVCQAGPTGVLTRPTLFQSRQNCDFCSALHLTIIIIDVHGNLKRRKALPLIHREYV